MNIVLGAEDGRAARELATAMTTVLLWRKRYETDGLAGLFADRPRSGPPRRISEDKEAAIVEATVKKTLPKNAMHWSVRSMTSTQKVNPATVLSVDEKSQIRALDRTQPILPLRPRLPERQTRDYRRHVTTTVFAALKVLDGTVIGECQPRHQQKGFLRFLNRIDESVQASLDIHVVLDNYGTHKHPEVKKWLAERPRDHVHLTPPSSPWFNQVERWLAKITRKRIRRGTFRSVRELTLAIHDYIRTYNDNPRTFIGSSVRAASSGRSTDIDEAQKQQTNVTFQG